MGNWTPEQIANVIIQATAFVTGLTLLVRVLRNQQEVLDNQRKQKKQLRIIHALGNSNLGVILEDKAILAETIAKDKPSALTIEAARKARAAVDEHKIKQEEADKAS